jgi:endoglucanase
MRAVLLLLALCAAGRPIALAAETFLHPKVNQVGYLPEGRKRFAVVAETASRGDAFEVVDEEGRTAYTGRIEAEPISDEAAGETVLRGDFSALTRPGRYAVRMGGTESHPFLIAEDVYDPLFADAARCFYIIRANVPLDDPVTGISHPAAHVNDAEYDTRPGELGDFKGGWYNAGDYGKWTHEAAFSAACMMWLYELRGEGPAGRDDLRIPESGNGMPDILDEARWGLEWLLKMQNEDGSVYHKVDTEPDFAWGRPPEEDPHPRKVRYGDGLSTVDAADFVGAMAQAARVFGPFDAEFAATCREAAERSWPWVVAHPDLPQKDPYYTRNETWPEVFWALGEMYRLTGDADLAGRLAREAEAHPLSELYWNNPQAFGYMAVITAPHTPNGLRTSLQGALTRTAERRLEVAAGTGYGVPLEPKMYMWGSNAIAAGRANVMLFAHHVTGRREFLDGAQAQLDYLLGLNALDQCFVTGYGTRRNEHPFHWTWRVYGKLMPGWLSGGPNRYPTGADQPLRRLQEAGTPPAKCWLDLCTGGGSWASNEGTTDHNAQLLFLAGWLSGE